MLCSTAPGAFGNSYGRQSHSPESYENAHLSSNFETFYRSCRTEFILKIGGVRIAECSHRSTAGYAARYVVCCKEDAMRRSYTALFVGVGSLILGMCWLLGVANAQQPAPTYPLDDKLASEPAPWTAKGKW